MTQLEISFNKIELPGLDHAYYLERLRLFPENEWFIPANTGEANDFQICYELCQWNLIQKKNEPVWVNGSFRGQRILFRYSNDLKYGKKSQPLIKESK